MGLFGKSRKEDSIFDEEWITHATHKELLDAYDKERERMRANGYRDSKNGRTTPLMDRLNEELKKHAEKEWENDPRRSKDPNFHWSDKNRWE